MKRHGLFVLALLALAGGLGYIMHAMDMAKHPAPPSVPKEVKSVRASDLEKLTDPKAQNWQLDLTRKVVKTKSGLQYQDLGVGKGPKPKLGDQVFVDYVGWNSHGRVFDTSLQEGRQPIILHVGKGEVIKGWDEGIGTMRVGGIRRLVIPPDLAYGEIGSPPAIEPNSTLTFMVRLLEVKPAE